LLKESSNSNVGLQLFKQAPDFKNFPLAHPVQLVAESEHFLQLALQVMQLLVPKSP
jgi:hypothetical protein